MDDPMDLEPLPASAPVERAVTLGRAHPSRRRRLALAGVTVVTALVSVGVASIHSGGAPPRRLAEPSLVAVPGGDQPWPTNPSTGGPRASATPSAGASPSATGTAADQPAPAAPGRTASGGPAVAPVASSPTPPSPAAVTLSPGSRVGLEPFTHPGYRVRHYNLTGRIDPIGTGSSAVDKADSTFTVRAGLAAAGCVSLESVNYPGYYLRHQNFRIYLHQRDGTGLFAADATFCAVSGLAGQHVSLRSYNYPDRYLRPDSAQLVVATVDGDAARAAMTFIPRTGL